MAGFITRDHVCADCARTTIYMHERGAELDTVPCEFCGGPAPRILSATFIGDTSASYVDGSGRLNHIREQRKIEREFKKAKRQGRADDAKKLRKEMSKVVQ
jgi:hypothetical protein